MKKNRMPLAIALIIGLSAAYFLSTDHTKASETQRNIANKIIRFHVIANSDSEEDQNLKLSVKEAVITYASPLLENSKDINETREILAENTEEIISIANGVIENHGYSYGVKAYFTTSYFPTKSYGDVTFPSGKYEAYKIEIGESKGKNWWCVMYPPLCFIDASHGVLPDSSKETLKNVLDDEEYESITINNYAKKDLKFRFKYLTFLNKYL